MRAIWRQIICATKESTCLRISSRACACSLILTAERQTHPHLFLEFSKLFCELNTKRAYVILLHVLFVVCQDYYVGDCLSSLSSRPITCLSRKFIKIHLRHVSHHGESLFFSSNKKQKRQQERCKFSLRVPSEGKIHSRGKLLVRGECTFR